MIRRPPRSTLSSSSAASDVYKRQIIFYDLSRLARSVEEGLGELKRLLEEGFNVYFAGMDFLNYDIDPVLKKKVIMDFLWFAEVYVEDIKKRTAVAMERLRREGRVYHRPTVLHYLALYFSNKNSFAELTREDIEKAKEHLRRELRHLVELKVPWYKIHKLFLERYVEMYRSCLLYTSPSPRDGLLSRMPSSA